MTQISIPGKSFLVGEYSVLVGGPGLLLATAPFFESSYQLPSSQRTTQKIVDHSTAGKFQNFNKNNLKTNYEDLRLAWATHFHEDSPAGRLIALLILKMRLGVSERPKGEFADKLESQRTVQSSEQILDQTLDQSLDQTLGQSCVPWNSLLPFVTATHQDLLIFLNGEFEFNDPYAGSGGLGASTAQFLALVHCARENDIIQIENEWDLLQVYRGLASNGGQQPSGADLLAQNSGGLVLIHENNKSVKRIKWPFSHLNLFFVRTGVKVPTHEHLKGLSSTNFEVFASLSEIIQKTFEVADETKFLQFMNQFQKQLIDSGLQLSSSQELCHEAIESNHFVFAKGCGAMGADILALISDVTKSNMALSWIEQKGLKIVATLADVASGPRIFNGEECS